MIWSHPTKKKHLKVDVSGTRYDFLFWKVHEKPENTFRCSSFFWLRKEFIGERSTWTYCSALLDLTTLQWCRLAGGALSCITVLDDERGKQHQHHPLPTLNVEGIRKCQKHHHHHHHHHPHHPHQAFQFVRNHQAFQPSTPTTRKSWQVISTFRSSGLPCVKEVLATPSLELGSCWMEDVGSCGWWACQICHELVACFIFLDTFYAIFIYPPWN